jgi:hypothetical protein
MVETTLNDKQRNTIKNLQRGQQMWTSMSKETQPKWNWKPKWCEKSWHNGQVSCFRTRLPYVWLPVFQKCSNRLKLTDSLYGCLDESLFAEPCWSILAMATYETKVNVANMETSKLVNKHYYSTP